VLNPDGTITYTPTPGYVGPDSFSYIVSSGGVSETATISVVVTNAAPVANPDTASTPEDTFVSGNVLTNDTDSDPGDSKTVTQFVVDGVTVTVPAGAVGGSTLIAGVGTLTLKADGSYSFTPLADWNGSVPTVTYTLRDVAGATASSTLEIIVTAVADITADSVTTSSTAALVFDPLAGTNGATADNFEDPAAAVTAIGAPGQGTAVLNPDGTITYTPTPGYVGPDSFSYTVSSGGVSEIATISVVVTNAVPVANPDTASTPEDTPVSGNVLTNDTDSDSGDSKTVTQFVVDGVTVTVPAGAVGGSTLIAGVGNLTVKADGSYTFTPLADWNGSVPVVTYSIRDVAGATASSTLEIIVTAVADITADSVTTSSTAALVFDPLAGTNGATADNFEDPAAAITAIGAPGQGTAVLNPDGTITYTPTPGYVGPDSFSYTVSSGGVSETATISVVVTNAAPVANPDTASTPEDTFVSGNVLTNDTDSDPDDSKTVTQFVVDGVTVTVPAGAVGGSTLIAGVGNLTVKADGSYTFTPLADWNGSVPVVTYSIRDVAGVTASSTLEIIVTAVVDITADSVTTSSTAALVFDPLNGSNGATADNFEDPAAAITAIGMPAHGSAVLNPDGTITYTPTPGYVGPDSFSYTVSSGGVSETATISVVVTNAAPVANPDTASTPEDTPVSGNVLTNDTDSDPGDSKTVTQFVVDGVTIVVPAGAVGATTSIAGVGNLTVKADGSYSFSPLADWNGNVPTVTYTVRDMVGATASSTLELAVTPVADITADSVTTNSTGSVTFDPLAGTNGATADNFEDPAAAVTAIGAPGQGSAVLNPDGTITYTPTPGYVGPDSFSYTVSSGGVREIATISVVVTNAAPVANPDTASTPEDTPVSGNVLTNDTDSDPGDSKTVTQFVVDGVTVTVPAGAVGGSTLIAGVGNLTVKADGSYSFTPLADWNGSVPTVTYTLRDVAGATASSTLEIIVTAVADITADSVTTSSTAALVFDPLAGTNGATADNFEDPAAAITAIGAPGQGSAVLNPDGTITYTPTPGYVGPDSFSYTVSSGGVSETATISVVVTNAAPVANPDTASTPEDTPVSGNVLTNDTDSDPGDSKTVTQFVVDGVTIVVPAGAVGATTSIAGVGNLTVKADGSYSFSPLADWNGNVPTVTYTVRDMVGATASSTLELAVTPVADITADSVTTSSTGSVTFDPLTGTNGATADNFEDPAAAITAIGMPAHGTAVLNPDGTITYTPTPGYVGPDSFSYTVSSGGVSETATISVVVTNAAPVANPDTASTREDTPVSGNVLTNDTDSDSGDSKTVTQFVVDGVTVTVPAGAVGGSTLIAGVGTLTLKADGSYTFTPLADWNGSVPVVTYTVRDTVGATASSTLAIAVTPVADITADSVTTNSTGLVTFDPLTGTNGASADNFEDPAAAITAIGAPGQGTAVLNPDGTITYTPTPGYVGPDSFSYTVSSGGVSEIATISVVVTNAAPVANPDTASTPEDTPVSGNVLTNDTDSDPGDSKTVTQFVVDGVTVTVPAGAVGGSTLIAGVGTLTLKADGSYSFTPLADWNGNVPTVTYSIRDVAGAAASSTLELAVTPVADITADSVTTNSTGSVTFDPLTGTNSASADNFEDPAAAITAIGAPGQGSAVLNPDGTITYTPTPGYVGPDSFSYTVSSGGVSEIATISVVVTNAVPVANPDTASTPEDTPVSGNVLTNDTDSDSGDSKTVTQFVVDGVTVTVPAGAVGGSTLIAGVGNLTVKADGSYTFTPLADWNGSVPVVTYSIRDVAGATASSTLEIIVTAVADITADSVTTSSTAALVFDPLNGSNGASADNFEDPAAAVTAIGAPGQGTAVLNPDGTITYTPTPGYVGPDSFSYTVSSGGVSETATISVVVTNAAPVANPDTASTPEDTPVSGNVLTNDTDSDSGDSKTVTQFVVDGVTIVVPAGAVGATTSIAGVGNLTVKADGSYSFSPLADWNGNVPTVTYTVRDTVGATASSTLELAVTPVADITADSVTTNSTAALVFDPLAGTNGATADNFEDPAAAITAIGMPAHGSAVLNPDGTITYTPTPGYVGPDSFSYIVSSGGVSETATISVVVTNAAPVANPDTASTPEDTFVSGNVLTNDTDSDPGDSKTVTQFVVDGVTVTVPAGAVGGSTLIAGVGTLTLKADGSYSFTPLADWNGSVPTVTYTLRDVAGATASSTLEIIVTAVADITADSVTTSSTAALVFDPLAGTNGATADNFEDPAAAVTAIGAPGQGSAVLNPDGTITYTPTPGYVGPDSFSYTVSSGGVSEIATISVVVTNAAPVANPDTASTPEDTPVSGNVLTNDTDSDSGDSKTVTQFVVDGVTVTVPAGAVGGSTLIAGVGTLTLKADGSYSFTPLADWNGSVPTVTYTLRDVAGATASSTLEIIVTAVADITADSVTTSSTAALVFDPLAGTNGATGDNFEDPAAAITAIGAPGQGSAVLNPDGTITYTPTPGYVGPDSFSYTVSSGGVSETATISVVVTNAAPVANPDTASTPEDTPVSGNVLTNDTDSDSGDSKTVTQFVVDGVTVTVPAGAVGGSTLIAGVGTLTLKADGSYSFTPLADWNGSVPTVTYTLRDVAGATASSTLEIIVTAVADITADSVTTSSTAALVFDPLNGSNGASADNFEDPAAAITAIVHASPRQRRAQSRRHHHLHPDAGLRGTGQLQLYRQQRWRQRDRDDQRRRHQCRTCRQSRYRQHAGRHPRQRQRPDQRHRQRPGRQQDRHPVRGRRRDDCRPAGAVGATTSIAGVGNLTVKADGSYSFSPLADWNGNVPTVTYTVRDMVGATASSTLELAVTPGGRHHRGQRHH
jgi:CshA-type fibril repeat protein